MNCLKFLIFNLIVQRLWSFSAIGWKIKSFQAHAWWTWILCLNLFQQFLWLISKEKGHFHDYSTWFWDSIWKKPAVVGAQKMSSGSWVEEPLDLQCAGKDPLSIALFFLFFFFLSIIFKAEQICKQNMCICNKFWWFSAGYILCACPKEIREREKNRCITETYRMQKEKRK